MTPLTHAGGCLMLPVLLRKGRCVILDHFDPKLFLEAVEKEKITSTMIDFGIPGGDSSMNRTVGLPAAVGVRFILEGRFNQPGVVVPVMPEFYEPAIEELQRLGIQFTETAEEID